MEGWEGEDEKEDEEEEDEDGGEAAHHPDAHVQKEKWYEAQKFSTKSSFLSHRQSWSSVSAVWRESDHSNGILFLGWFREKTSSKEWIASPWGQNLFTPKLAQLGITPRHFTHN